MTTMITDDDHKVSDSDVEPHHSTTNRYPVKNIPIVPGTQQYSDKVKQNLPSDTTSHPNQSAALNLLVLSTSITKGIDTYTNLMTAL